MRYGKFSWSYVCLRIGLGIVFLWIGIDILRHPDVWLGYVPANIPFGLKREVALRANGLFDFFVGLLLFANWWPKMTATLAAGHLLTILVMQGIDAVLIRDVGLLGASLALLAWPSKRREHDRDR